MYVRARAFALLCGIAREYIHWHALSTTAQNAANKPKALIFVLSKSGGTVETARKFLLIRIYTILRYMARKALDES